MQRERVSDDIYVFTSELYAQVTAGLVLTEEGAVLIDTLLYPEETRAIRQFVEGRLGTGVRYVINTHYHADHTYGTYLFPEATVVAHRQCYDLLNTRGRAGLEQAKQNAPEFADVQVVLPHLTFSENTYTLPVGGKTFQFFHTPGHSADSVIVLVKEDRVLFGADTLMAIPYFVDGDYTAFLESLRGLQYSTLENVIPGHGDIVLRGEIEEKVTSDIHYLVSLKKYVETALRKHDPKKYLDRIDIERCGKSRALLNGTAQRLHHANLYTLFDRMRQAASVQAS
jgi:glyoxylase-like metal-dependent hydrolase (beta-lactamase superfamily II)